MNNELQKLENIIFKLYEPNPSEEIKTYCNNIKNHYLSNLYNFHELFNCLSLSVNKYFQFYIIDILIEIIETKYNELTPDLKSKFLALILEIISNHIEKLYTEKFIANKFCYMIIHFLIFDFPQNNNNFFKNIHNDILNTTDNNKKILKLTIYLDIFLIFDDELVKYKHANTEFLANKSTIIKEYLRNNEMKEILDLLFIILSNEEILKENVIKKCIKVVSELIDWVIINSFGNIMQLILNKYINNLNYIDEIIQCLTAIIKKGMEPQLKIEIIQNIKINSIIENYLNLNGLNTITLEYLAGLINETGNILLEVYANIKSFQNNNNSEFIKLLNNANEELFFIFNYINKVMTYNNIINYKESLVFIDFLTGIVSYLKSYDNLIFNNNNKLFNSFKDLYNCIENSLLIPQNEYDIKEDLSKEKEDEYFEYRKEFAILFYNIFQINSIKEYILNKLIEKINNIKNNKNNLYEIELVLYLLGLIQPSISKLNNEKSLFVYETLMNFDFISVDSDYIKIIYFETINKIFTSLPNDFNTIDRIIRIFLSQNGILYNKQININLKIINNFDVFLTKIKGKINKNFNVEEYYFSVFNYLQNIIDVAIKNKNFVLISQYQILFHCLGVFLILIFNNNSDKNYCKNILENLLKLYMKIPLNFDNNNLEIFIENLKILIQILKNFTFEIKDENFINLFKDFFNNFIQNICDNNLKTKNKNCLINFINILQSLIIFLGTNSMQYIEYFFFNNFITNEIFEESIKLAQNIINYLDKNSKNFVQKIFYNFYNFVVNLNLPSDTISDINRTILNIYADFMKFIQNISLKIPEILFELNGIDIFTLINFLIKTSVNIIDIVTRRKILKSLSTFCKYLNVNNNKFLNEFKDLNNLLNIILNGTLNVYVKLNLNEPLDSSTMVEICLCHYYLSVFNNFYYNFLIQFFNKEQAEIFYNILHSIDPKKISIPQNLKDGFNFICKKKFSQ